jgi:deoxyadenosine/deoxycytidine kinase
MNGQHKNMPVLVSLEGVPGAGKSTLLNWFRGPSITTIPEPVEKWVSTPLTKTNLLQGLYAEPNKFGFLFNTMVGLTRIEQLIESQHATPVRIMERSIFSTVNIFAEHQAKNGTLSPVEQEVLHTWYNQVQLNQGASRHCGDLVIDPDLVVYLRTAPDIAWRRLQMRGRPEEKQVTEKYIARLSRMHDRKLMDESDIIPGTVVMVDGNRSKEYLAPIYQKVLFEIEKIQKRKWKEHLEMETFMNDLEGEHTELQKRRREKKIYKEGRVYIAGYCTADESDNDQEEPDERCKDPNKRLGSLEVPGQDVVDGPL